LISQSTSTPRSPFQEEYMRKVALFCAALPAAALGVTAVASAIQGTQTVSVKLQNNRAGTKAKPRSVSKLTVVTGTTPVPGEPPFATRRAVIHFDKNLVFGSSRFAGCAQAQVQSDDTKCPAGSKVGTGSAKASVFSGPTLTSQVSPTVTAYNGPRGTKVFLLVKEPTFNVRSVLIGSLKTDTGKYGRKLDVAIPANLQAPLPGLVVTLTQFITSVGKTAKGTPYVALRGCTGGKLAIKGDFFYTDNTSKSATSTTKCRAA
jgi:hypothetical protein